MSLRRWICLFLLLAAAAVAAQAQNLLTNPGFEDGLTGWNPHAGGAIERTSTAHTGSWAARAYNRTMGYQGIAQNVLGVMQPGRTCRVGAWIRLENADSDKVSITLRIVDDRGTTYPHIVDAAAYGDRWTHIYDYHTLEISGPLQSLTLYVEGPEAGVNFYVDDMHVEPAEGHFDEWIDLSNQRIDQFRRTDVSLTVCDLAGRPVAGAAVDVEQIRKHFAFGAAVSHGAMSNDFYTRFLKDNFEWVVPENAAKWRHNQPNPGSPNYYYTDLIADFCRVNDMPIRAHCIFWANQDRVPDWAVELNDDDLLAAMESRIESVVGRYKDRFLHWDVNNEMLRHTYFKDRFGDAIRVWMFQKAKQVDPDCQLFVNDYGVVSGGMTLEYKQHIQDLIDAGAPVDGIGVQCHMGGAFIAPDLVWDRLSLLAELGLPIWVTEYDFKAEDEQKRADALEMFYRVAYSHPAVKGILMWGFWENAHWREDAHLVDADWHVNAAGRRYQDLMEEWSTREQVRTDSEGRAALRAGYGRYRIRIQHPQRGSTVKVVDISPDRPAPTIELPCDLQGLRYEYFEGDFTTVSQLQNAEPIQTGLIHTFTNTLAARPEQYGIRFEGYIRIAQPGDWTFYVESDDGSRLYIGDEVVVDHDGLHQLAEASATVALPAGMHPIRVEYIQGHGRDDLLVSLAGPGRPRAPIPPQDLFQQPVAGPGDVTLDQRIDMADFAALSSAWRTSDPRADLNGDDTVDEADLSALLEDWLAHTRPHP